jgi:periplasmic protein TonB
VSWDSDALRTPANAYAQTLAPIPRTMRLMIPLILGLTMLVTDSFGQKKDSVTSDTTIFADPMIYPAFPGGQSGLTEYIAKNFNWTQGQLTVEGKVFVEFIVDIDGKIKDVKVIRGLCESCDKEAVRLVKNMPSWTPGTQNGAIVRTRMVIPIKFGL